MNARSISYDVGILSCGKKKRHEPARARDLYTSAYFRECFAWLEERTEIVFILSAKHGLVHPEEFLEPYDVTLTPDMVEAWAVRVNRKLLQMFGGLTFLTTAAGLYLRALHGLDYVAPFNGVPIGKRRALMRLPKSPFFLSC